MRPSKDTPLIYLFTTPVDLRKATVGLFVLVKDELSLNPFVPALFVFINRRNGKIEILYWEKNGFYLWYKRLEKQTFKWSCEFDEAAKKVKPKRKPLPSNLSRVRKESELQCSCGCTLTEIDEDVSEQLDIIPDKFQG